MKYEVTNLRLFRTTIVAVVLFAIVGVGARTAAAAQRNVVADPQRPRVALALSVGGAKGFAHIGVIKALEEAGIYVDIVTGVSMGCVVGSLYATGRYSGANLEQLADQDWDALLQDGLDRAEGNLFTRDWQARTIRTINGTPQMNGLMRPMRIVSMMMELLWPELRINDTTELPRPLACLAADIQAKDARDASVLLTKGSIVDIVAASMALPILFTPVWIDGQMLSDGGMYRALPVAEAIQLGADVVIAIDLTSDVDPSSPSSSTISQFDNLVKATRYEQLESQREKATVLVRPDVEDIKVTDFESAAAAIERGYEAMKRQMGAVRAAVEQREPVIALEEQPYVPGPSAGPDVQIDRNTPVPGSPIDVRGCSVEWADAEGVAARGASTSGFRASLEATIHRILDCRRSAFDKDRVLETLHALQQTELFDYVSIYFRPVEDGHELVVNAIPHPGGSIGGGVGLNGRGMYGYLNYVKRFARAGQLVRLHALRNAYSRVNVDYVRNGPFGTYLWGGGRFTRIPKSSGAQLYLPPNYAVIETSLKLALAGRRENRFAVGATAATSPGPLGGGSEATVDVELVVDNLNDPIFPTRGASFSYKYRQSVVNPWKSHTLNMKLAMKVNSGICVLVQVGGQYIHEDRTRHLGEGWSTEERDAYRMPLIVAAISEPLGGSSSDSRTFGSFAGMKSGVFVSSFMQAASISVQARLAKSLSVVGRVNVASLSDHLDGKLTPDGTVVGGSVTVVKDTMLGQLSMSAGGTNFSGTPSQPGGFSPHIAIGFGTSR